MTDVNCDYCGKLFSDKYILKRHIDTSKKCIELRDKLTSVNNIKLNNNVLYRCNYCYKSLSTKSSLEIHLSKCQALVSIQNQEIKIQELEKCIQKQQIMNIKLEEANKALVEAQEEYKLKIAKLENTIESLANKAIENTGAKTTTNNIISNRNQIIQNLQPLTDEYMREQSKLLTTKNIENGTQSIAHFASKYTFKDRIYCSDVARLNFIFKNEDNIIVKDPEGIEITKKFIDINKPELLRLLQEYYQIIVDKLVDDNLDNINFSFWSEKREEIYYIIAAVKKGNIPENKESYKEFKRNFLSALKDLVVR